MGFLIEKFLLFVFLLNAVVGKKSPHCSPAGELPVANNQSTRCGKVLTAEKGRIHYTPPADAFEHERCIWIIAAPKATTYDISIVRLNESINRPARYNALIITDDDLKDILPTCESWYNILSPVLIITYATGTYARLSTGFTLQYVVKDKETLNGNSTHCLRTSTSHWTKYPSGSANYNNYEYSAQVFLPPNNFYTATDCTLRYKVPGPYENLCHVGDYVMVYKFQFPDVQSDHKWWGEGVSFCTTIPSQLQITHNDALLTVFRSDRENTTPGFWLQFT